MNVKLNSLISLIDELSQKEKDEQNIKEYTSSDHFYDVIGELVDNAKEEINIIINGVSDIFKFEGTFINLANKNVKVNILTADSNLIHRSHITSHPNINVIEYVQNQFEKITGEEVCNFITIDSHMFMIETGYPQDIGLYSEDNGSFTEVLKKAFDNVLISSETSALSEKTKQVIGNILFTKDIPEDQRNLLNNILS